ncbi:MAG: ROK family protein [Enterocloster asparagiformis]|nr:ROK family protein [Enterocloster asparagiformis]
MNTSFYAGIDMGGTNIKGAITTPLLETICTDFIPTVPDSGDKSFETITARAVMLIERMMEHAGLAPEGLKAVGMGMAGIIDASNAVLLQFNALGWSCVQPSVPISNHFHVPVYLTNDGTANLLGEAHLGAARGIKDVLLITLGTGVGGAVMVDGNILSGSKGLGGEIGHIVIDQGKSFQQYCSATAITDYAQEQMQLDRGSLLWTASSHNPQSVTAKMICDCAHRHDPLCLRVVERTALHLGYALISFINVFNPGLILIGGGLSRAGDLLLGPAIRQTLSGIHHPRLACPIRLASLGPEAGALGACALARLQIYPPSS